MATSESDGFESADDEINHDTVARRNFQAQQWSSPAGIDSESDDDAEYVPRTPCPKVYNKGIVKPAKKRSMTDETEAEEINKNTDTNLNDRYCNEQNELSRTNVAQTSEGVNEEVTSTNLQTETVEQADTSTIDSEAKGNNTNPSFCKDVSKKHLEKKIVKPDEKVGNQKKSNAKKLGTKLTQSNDFVDDEDSVEENIKRDFSITEQVFTNESSLMDEMAECEMPEEMKSDKKFKDVFKTEGWEGLGNEIELPEELTEEKLQPILKRLSLAGQESENASGVWGWGNWGVSSLITTATVGVSTLTSHVSHGLTLLEESMNITEESKSTTEEPEENSISNGSVYIILE